jgi:hypothetical protein
MKIEILNGINKQYRIKLQNNMNLKIKENTGITLIALVITILVLLILARNYNRSVNRRKWNIN